MSIKNNGFYYYWNIITVISSSISDRIRVIYVGNNNILISKSINYNFIFYTCL